MGTAMASSAVTGRTVKSGRSILKTPSRRYPKRMDEKQGAEPRRPRDKKWLGLVIVLIGPFLGTIDFFIANIGIPSMRSALGASFSQVELVVAGYGLTYAVFLITGGRLGDIYGRKRLFLAGMAGFTVASALCGCATNANSLIFWRALQGCAAALMFPQALSFIHINFTGSAKRLAFSAYGAMIGFGSITGQILGGFLIEANVFGLGWRPIFLINLPIGALTIWAASAALDESRAERAARLDPIGMLIVSLGLCLFSFPFLEGRESGWPPWAWVSLLSSIPVFWGFLRFEQRQARLGHTPLLEPRLLRDRGFVIGLLVTCIYFAGHTSMLLVLSLYLQLSLNLNPMNAGLALVPFSFGFLVGSSVSGKLNGYLGRNSLHLGTAVLATSLIALIKEAGGGWREETLLFGITCFVYGIGRGFVTAPLFNTVLSGVPARDAGAASGVASTMQQVANSVGIAVIGAVVFSVISANPHPSGYAHGFVIAGIINLGMLVIASVLLCFIPKSRGRDIPSAKPLLVEA